MSNDKTDKYCSEDITLKRLIFKDGDTRQTDLQVRKKSG